MNEFGRGKCTCGCTCTFTVRVKFPNGKSSVFCDAGCSAYKAEKKQADKAWKSFRRDAAKRFSDGAKGRQEAAAAKVAKPKPGSQEARLARVEREARRAANRESRLANRPVGRS